MTSFRDWLFKAANGQDEAVKAYAEWLAAKLKLKKRIIAPDADEFEKWRAFTNGNAPKGVPGSRIRIAFRAAWSEYTMAVKPSAKSDDSYVYAESSLLQMRKSLLTSNEIVDEADSTIRVHRFVTAPVRSGLSIGLTVPIEQYNNAKVNVSINVPHYAEESNETWNIMCQLVESRLNAAVKRVVEIAGGNPNDIPDLVSRDREITSGEVDATVGTEGDTSNGERDYIVRERPKRASLSDEELGIGTDRDLFAFDMGDDNG